MPRKSHWSTIPSSPLKSLLTDSPLPRMKEETFSGSFTRYGLLNAVTAASKLADYDRATELERIGGEILALPVQDRSKTVIRIPTEKEKRIHDLALETAHHYTRA